MVRIKGGLLMVMIFTCMLSTADAQEKDSSVHPIVFPVEFLDNAIAKTSHLDQGLTKKTEKYLRAMSKAEKKLAQRLAKTDSTAARAFFAGAQENYSRLIQKLKVMDTKSSTLSGEYLPYADSLKTMLSFFNQSGNFPTIGRATKEKVATAVKGFNQLQSRFEMTSRISEFVKERKCQLGSALSKYGKAVQAKKYLDQYYKQARYFSDQITVYKQMLNDPDKLQKRALLVLNKIPVFQQFMKSNSVLSSFMNLGTENASISGGTDGILGLIPRDQVASAFQLGSGTMGANVNGLIQQQVQGGQSQLQQLRDRLRSGEISNGEMDLPNFKGADQSTKSFWKRLEYGSSMQTVHGSYYYPNSTAFGLTLAYKVDSKNSIGIGVDYKAGWGKDIKHVNVTSEGVGFRGFLDIQLKTSFFATGGFEYNYQEPFTSLGIVRDIDNWQQSGLIGISKTVSLKSNLFKKSKLQLLWDFLSYRQVPRTQALKFRVGYSF
jgi:hypothetical protein